MDTIFPSGPKNGRVYDYDAKYPDDDDPFKNPTKDPNARVWRVYNDEADIYDEEMYQRWKDTTDVLLVFTGLFSAVVTTFLVEASSAFQDSQQILVSQIAELVSVQRALATGNSVINVPPSVLQPGSDTASTLDRWVNGLWLVSLLLSLVAAVITLLVKQWLHHYMSGTSGTPRDQAVIRQFRFDSLTKWKVEDIIEVLPLLLHVSLFLFFGGLAIYEWQLDRGLSIVVLFIGGIAFIFYLIVNILPVCCPDCPYFTPLAQYLFTLLTQKIWLIKNILGPGDIRLLRVRESVHVLYLYEPDSGKHRYSHLCAKAALWLYTERCTNPIVRKIMEQVPMAMTDDISQISNTAFDETWEICKNFIPSFYDIVSERSNTHLDLAKASLYLLSLYSNASDTPRKNQSGRDKDIRFGLNTECVPTYLSQCMALFPINFAAVAIPAAPYHLFALVRKCVYEDCHFRLNMVRNHYAFTVDSNFWEIWSHLGEKTYPMIAWITWILSEPYIQDSGSDAHDNIARYILFICRAAQGSSVPTKTREIFRIIQRQLVQDAIQGEVDSSAYERVAWIRSVLQLNKTENQIYVYRCIESGPEGIDEERVEHEDKPCYRKRAPFQPSMQYKLDIQDKWGITDSHDPGSTTRKRSSPHNSSGSVEGQQIVDGDSPEPEKVVPERTKSVLSQSLQAQNVGIVHQETSRYLRVTLGDDAEIPMQTRHTEEV